MKFTLPTLYPSNYRKKSDHLIFTYAKNCTSIILITFIFNNISRELFGQIFSHIEQNIYIYIFNSSFSNFVGLYSILHYSISTLTNFNLGMALKDSILVGFIFSQNRTIRTSLCGSWLIIYHYKAHMPNLDTFEARFLIRRMLGP